MLHEAIRKHPGEVEEKLEQTVEHAVEHRTHRPVKDPTRGWSLLALSVGTSLDALVVGFSLGIRGSGSIWAASVVIGVVAAAMSLVGALIGTRLGKAIGPVAEAAGAVLLMGLGVTFLFA